MSKSFISVVAVVAALSACGPAPMKPASPQQGTAQASTAISAPSSVAPAEITIPEVAGRNAEIVRKELGKLGLKDIQLVSDNPKYKAVFSAANWTVVSIEPAPGAVVKPDDTVIVKVTKP